MFDFNGDGDVSHKESAAGFLILAASTIIIVISATTTYGFFSTYFPAIVSPALVGPMYAQMISGMIGVLCFDLMTVTFLMAFLYHAGTPEQRAISLTMVFVTFGFSAIASAAHLYMSASGNMAADAATLTTLRNIAMVAVVAGVVIDFGAWISYTRYSYGSKMRVREADRRDNIQKAEQQQANYLDALVQQQVKEKLEAQASELAQLQATRLAGIFATRERAKYHDGGQPSLPAASVAADTRPAPASLTPARPEREPRPQNGRSSNPNNGADFPLR